MKRKKYVALLTMLAMVACIMFHPTLANATIDTDSLFSDENVIKTGTCTYNNIERTFWIVSNGELYLKFGDNDPVCINMFSTIDSGFDRNGALWFQNSLKAVCWFNPDLQDTKIIAYYIIAKTDPEDEDFTEDVTNLVYDDQNYVTGYKLSSGETRPLISLEKMKLILGIYDTDDPTPTPDVPTPSPTATPTPVPTATPTNTKKPVVTPKPTVSPQSTAASKVSLKKQSGYNCLSVGNKVVSKYKLKKGVLTWKGTKKSLKIKQVKQAGFIKKSKNLIYITKKGKAYTISQKGKKKTILKKGAKKLIFKNGYVTKVKKKSGYTNVANK